MFAPQGHSSRAPRAAPCTGQADTGGDLNLSALLHGCAFTGTEREPGRGQSENESGRGRHSCAWRRDLPTILYPSAVQANFHSVPWFPFTEPIPAGSGLVEAAHPWGVHVLGPVSPPEATHIPVKPLGARSFPPPWRDSTPSAWNEPTDFRMLMQWACYRPRAFKLRSMTICFVRT